MSDDERISYLPGPDLTYNPEDAHYWEPQSLQTEIERAFEICHGCRMCFKFCDSFPILFNCLDEDVDGDVKKINASVVEEVMNACFQCKLCEVQCPYTPRDEHEFQLDFPKIVHRYKAQRHKAKGSSARDKLLGDPDKAASLARASFGMANKMNRVKLHRVFMEKALGIHRDKLLPDFASQTFEKWAEKSGKMGQPGGEAVLFPTCYVQNNEPQIGRDTLEVLETNGVDCRCTHELGCCGMPAWESGDLDKLREMAHHNIDQLMPWVEAGAKILAINPTCSMMMRREYAELVAPDYKEKALKMAEAISDPSEFLWKIRKEERFSRQFKSTPNQPVAYHAPCHLRAQGVGFKGRDLIRMVPGVKPKLVMECCGHDGTYAMKVEGFDASQKVGKKAFDEMKEAESEVWATDCPLAALQFQQHAGVKPMHPMSFLAQAYRQNGFKHPVEEEEE